MTHVVVTGASGFLGRAIVHGLLTNPALGHVTASDLVPFGQNRPRLTDLPCALDDPALLTAVSRADVIIHLAATLGGAAEADPAAAFGVNVAASLALMGAAPRGARFVFASSLAVLGDTPDQRAPVMTYGAHKAMVEIAIETATRRGEIDGISLRPGGIVARAGQDSGLKSAFLSQVFWAVRDGRDIVLPVSPLGHTNLASVRNVADNFLHAAWAKTLGPSRSLTLPMLCVSFADLVQALRSAFPSSPSTVRYAPDPQIDQIFGRASLPDIAHSLNAGFAADADLAALVNDAMEHGEFL